MRMIDEDAFDERPDSRFNTLLAEALAKAKEENKKQNTNQFIEIHLFSDNRPVSLNVKYISTVCAPPSDEYAEEVNTLIFIGIATEPFCVVETYQEVKAMIEQTE